MTEHLPLGPGGEFDRIRGLLEAFGDAGQGIGDDAAVLPWPAGRTLVASVDASVEGVHFRAGWLDPEEIGWRAAQAALSDLAAMGATPVGLLLAWTVPASRQGWLEGLARGTAAAARAQRAAIMGGNLSGGAELSLTTTVLGHAARPVGRGGARPGDLLYLSGALGGPGAAVEAWSAGAAPDAAARTRFARPEARVALGAWLAAAGATAMIDISDGLLADAAHLAAASGVLLRLDPSLVPRLASVGVEAALRSGEEYELLAAAGPLDVVAAAAAGGVPLTCIGRVEATDGPPGVMVPGAGGGWVRVDRSGGWDHLS